MKIFIKFFMILCFVCNMQIFAGFSISESESNIYFSKKVFNSAVGIAKAQLSQAYFYYRSQMFEAFNFTVDIPDETSPLLEELDLIQKHAQEDFVKISFDYFDVLLRNMSYVYKFLTYIEDLKISFDNYKLLKADVFKKLQSYDEDENFKGNFRNYCILIDELFDLNEKLIKECKLQTTPFQGFKFADGLIEYLHDEQYAAPSYKDYLFVYFTN